VVVQALAGVVLDPPVLVQHLSLEQGIERLDAEQFVAQPAAEALHIRVLPGCAGLDVAGPRAGEPAPVPQGVGGQLGPAIAADAPRWPPALDDQAVQGRDGASASILRSTVIVRASRVFVDHVGQLQGPPSVVWSNW
jgi:hypothetical protein